jgi:N-methylhydantoinase A
VVNAAMARAVRTISVERGHNPRDFALVAFGGAGPLHAVHLAQELGMTSVIVPRYPGVLSALGMLSAAVTRSTTRTLQVQFDQLQVAQLNAIIATTAHELTTALMSDGEQPAAFGHTIHLAMRYRGQAFELDVPVLSNLHGTPQIDEAMLQQSQHRFHELHQRRYGHANPARAIEIAMLRHTMASAATPLPTPVAPHRDTPCTPVHTVVAYPNDDTTAVMTAIYQRELLVPHDVIVGPAVITQLDATTVIPSGWQALVHATLTMTITPV